MLRVIEWYATTVRERCKFRKGWRVDLCREWRERMLKAAKLRRVGRVEVPARLRGFEASEGTSSNSLTLSAHPSCDRPHGTRIPPVSIAILCRASMQKLNSNCQVGRCHYHCHCRCQIALSSFALDIRTGILTLTKPADAEFAFLRYVCSTTSRI